MTLRDSILAGLVGRVDVESLTVDKEADLHGVKVISATLGVVVNETETQEHLFTFPHSANMTGAQMADVIISYLPAELVKE
jgi:hypothetical protein